MVTKILLLLQQKQDSNKIASLSSEASFQQSNQIHCGYNKISIYLIFRINNLNEGCII